MPLPSVPFAFSHCGAEEKNQIRAFQKLLPGMVNALLYYLDTSDEASARRSFDVLRHLIPVPVIDLLGERIPQLVQLFLHTA